MKRQDSVWYIKIEEEWVLLEDFPSQPLHHCIIRTILHKGATFVC